MGLRHSFAVHIIRAALVLFAMTMLAAADGKTVQDRIQEYGSAAEARWAPYFKDAEIPYPPQALALIGLKEEKMLEVYGQR